MITPDGFNNLVDECIDHLCDDSISFGAESLVELARIYAKAGIPRIVFNNMRQYIIAEATARTGSGDFIKMKLENAEQVLQNRRCLKIVH